MKSNDSPSRRASDPRTAEQLSARALARTHREAMRRRARRIRRSVACFAVATFIAAFGTVYVQLASGHDPALVADARRAASASTLSASTSSAKDTSTSSSESSSGSSSSNSDESSNSASAVTTSQS